MTKNSKLFFAIYVLYFGTVAFGAERSGQARLFLGSTQIKPTSLNTELTAQGIKAADLHNQAGVEITFPVVDNLNLGLRYSKRLISQDGLVPTTNYRAELNQDVAAFVARYGFFKTDFIRLDAVVGVGGSTTSYLIKSATQDGELNKKGSPFASLYSTAGVSVSVGKGKFYFVIEGGIDSQKIDGFEKSGNINNNVSEIDLSGGYFNIGLMFDGIPIKL
jgi:hypothetical protein